MSVERRALGDQDAFRRNWFGAPWQQEHCRVPLRAPQLGSAAKRRTEKAVVVKTVLGSHFGVFGAPPILVYFSGD